MNVEAIAVTVLHTCPSHLRDGRDERVAVIREPLAEMFPAACAEPHGGGMSLGAALNAADSIA